MRLIRLFVLGILAIALMSTNALAEYHKINESRRNDFNARLEHIGCRIELTKKQIDLFSSVNSSISSYKSNLDEDYENLQELASALNHKEFDRYFTTTFKENLMNAVNAVRDAKRDFRRSNLTQEQRTELREFHRTALSEFADCVDKSDRDLAEARKGYLSAWLNRWENIIEKMKEKGHDTSEMESVLADAKNRLIPAREAIKTATKENRRSAMEDARNLHLYLWSRFEIARIRSYLKSIEDEAISAGYESDVNAINQKLTTAGNIAVPGKKHGRGEFESVWREIKDAAKMLKDLNKKLKR